MIIIGAGGLAKEVFQIISESLVNKEIYFYDDWNMNKNFLYDHYPIIHDDNSLYQLLQTHEYTIAIGGVLNRVNFHKKLSALNGKIASTISSRAYIGSKNVSIGGGSNIFANVMISNDVKIGTACLIYYNAVITHDVIIGDFVELSPNCTLLGNSEIGNFTHIGSNAVILPKIKVGNNCIIGAGAVVTKNVPDNTIVAGVPAKKLKER
ncbi:hexapeptide transferase [Flavobacteriaceae bacterium Ap0902]|nr:hexapeptide transferase [Flavobacteriaceae bacterium Ap0902]